MVEELGERPVALEPDRLDGVDEAAEGGGRSRRDPRDRLAASGGFAGVPDREPRRARVLREPRAGDVADTARGDVDDAQQARLIETVLDQTQVGDEVFDLAALIEAHAADQAVGNAMSHERVLDRARLRVRAVEHGELAERTPGYRESFDLAGDELALLIVVVGLVSS